jgi:hypothetical protein
MVASIKRLVCRFILVCLVSLVLPDEPNQPDTNNQIQTDEPDRQIRLSASGLLLAGISLRG